MSTQTLSKQSLSGEGLAAQGPASRNSSSGSSANGSAASDPTPSLLLYRGDRELVREPLPEGRQLVLGRTGDCDVRLLHPSVSRTHARIWTQGAETWIEDLGTVHGTTVNGVRCVEPSRLPDGARIELGRSAADGWMLAFEDPSLALLRAMGLLEDPQPEADGEAVAEAAGESVWDELADLDPDATVGDPSSSAALVGGAADETGVPNGDVAGPAEIQAELSAGEAEDVAADQDANARAGGQQSETDAGPVKLGFLEGLSRRAAASLRNPFLWCGALLCLVTTATLVWAVRGMEPAEVGWRWVQLAPPSPSVGDTLSLKSPDIGPSDDLRLDLGGVQIVPDVAPGLLRFEVPELWRGPGPEPGVHEVPLVARSGDLEVFRVTVSLQVRPRIEAVEPTAVEVGAEAWIQGSHLVPSGGVPPTVTVGDAQAEVLDWGAERLRIRIPDFDLDEAIQKTVSVHAGSLSGRAPAPMEIRPRPPEPDPPFAELRKRHGSWWLAPRVGPMMCFGSRTAAARHVEAWHHLLDFAADDPSVRLEQRREGSVYVLSAAGHSLAEPLELGRFTADQLQATTGKADIPPGALSQWLVTVWQPLVSALGRGVSEEISPSSGLGAGYFEALTAVVAARDLLSVRHDRPHHHLAEVLPPGASARLAGALRDVPSHLGSVSGRWAGRLENTFFPGEGYRLLLDLEVHQFQETLGGTATLRLVRGEEEGIEFTLPPARLVGELRSGLDQGLTLRAEFARPIGKLELRAQVVGGSLRGVYRGAAVPTGDGRWKAERQIETATDW